jgi:hypothetical protein
MKISENDALKVLGLLTLAAHHTKMLTDIQNAVIAITGEESGDHSIDAVWSSDVDPVTLRAQLFDRLEIEVEKAPGFTKVS